MLAVGLLLFTGCDIIIGLQFVCIYLSLPTTSFIYQISHSVFNVAWLFYLPSQVMLATQIFLHNKKEKNAKICDVYIFENRFIIKNILNQIIETPYGVFLLNKNKKICEKQVLNNKHNLC